MKRTKYERKFFDIAENLRFDFDDEGKPSFQKYDGDLYDTGNALQSEIIENCTRLNSDERTIYLNRLRERLKIVGLPWYFVKDKPNQFSWNDNEGLIVNDDIPIDESNLIERGLEFCEENGNTYILNAEEIQQYREMLIKHKQLLLQLIIKAEQSIVFHKKETKNRHSKQANQHKNEPKTFEELFYTPKHAKPCLQILSELQNPAIDADNNYIGKAKGVFPLWVKVLKNHKPNPLIKHCRDTIYKDLLNQKVKGLNLSKDASEFRKQYVRLEKNKIELDIKTILSQYSQSGKLGK